MSIFCERGNSTIEAHLAELKKRLFISVVFLCVCFGLCLWKSNVILDLFLQQGRDAGYTLISMTPQDVLLQQLRVSLTFGFCIAMPVLLYHILMFVIPAIDSQYVFRVCLLVLIGVICFGLGVCFVVFCLFPIVLVYMGELTVSAGVLLEVSVESYISFYLLLIWLMGLIFEMPVVSFLLVSIGCISSKLLIQFRRPMIVIIFVIAAVITPPDVISQVLVGIPMTVLYEISICVCKCVERKKQVFK